MGLTIRNSHKNLEKLTFRLFGEQDHKYWDMRRIETRLVELAEQSGLAWTISDSNGGELFQRLFSVEEYNRWQDRREIPARYVIIQSVLFSLDNDTEISSEEVFYPRFLCLKLFGTDMADWTDVLNEEYGNCHDRVAFVKKLEAWIAQCSEFMPFPIDHKEYIRKWLSDKIPLKANQSKLTSRQPKLDWQKAVVLLVKAFTDVSIDSGYNSPVSNNKQQVAAAFAMITGYSEKNLYGQLTKINGGSTKIDEHALNKAKGFLKELIKALEKQENRDE